MSGKTGMLSSLFSLGGRVALITGAAQGLGLMMAEALAEAGARVIINDINAQDARARAADLQAQGLLVRALPFDVTDAAGASAAIQSIVTDEGQIDVLVNNAGISVRKRLFEFEEADWDRVIDLNLKAVYQLSQEVAKSMVAAGHGRIINMASIFGVRGRAGVIPYVAAKHGVVGVTKALASELGPRGVTCNAIGPGYFLTEINRKILDDAAFFKLVCDRTPLKRWGKPEELKGVVVFLASDASSYVNGHTLMVDGGISSAILQPEHVA